MSGYRKRLLVFLLTLCFILSNVNIAYAAPTSQQGRDLLNQCEEISDSRLRSDINNIIQEFFANEANFDFQTTVNRQWRTLNIDSTINHEIDKAVDYVNSDLGLVERFKSSWSPSKAKELAYEVTDIAFNSNELNRKLDLLSQNMSDELATQLELISARSSVYAIDCFQTFIGNKYSSIFVEEFARKIDASPPDIQQPLGDHNDNDLGLLRKKHDFELKGIVATIIAKPIAKKIAQQTANRLFGRLASGFIPIANIVSAALIGIDIVDSLKGTLPEIQKSLKKEEIKQTFRREIITNTEEELRNGSSQIASAIASDIYAEWLDFKSDYSETLDLIGELPEFKKIFERTANKSKIYSLVGISLNNMGRNQLVEAIQDGSFENSLSLPEFTYKIIENSNNLSVLEDWNKLAGSKLEEVVNLGIYKHLSPRELDRQTLKEILSLKDVSIISKLSLLEVNSIHELLKISQPNLLNIANRLSAEDLRRLADYLSELKPNQVNQLVRFLLDGDSSVIKNSDVMTYILQSRDLHTAIRFWEEPASMFSPKNIWNLYTGKVSFNLFMEKFGVGVSIMFLFIGLPLILLSIIGILLFRIRTKITNQENTPLIENKES